MNRKTSAWILIAAVGLAGVTTSIAVKYRNDNQRLKQSVAQLETNLKNAQTRPPEKVVVEKIIEVEVKPDGERTASSDEAARLRATLAEKEGELAKIKQEDKSPRPSSFPGPGGRSPEAMKDFFDKMKDEDPERYARMKEWRDGFRERMTDTLTSRIEYFGALDFSELPEDQRENYEVLMTKLNTLNELAQGIAENPDDISSYEMRAKAFGEVRGLSDTLRGTREALMNDMAKKVGFEGEDANDLVSYINEINEMTSMRSFFRGGRGSGGPPPGGNGGGENR